MQTKPKTYEYEREVGDWTVVVELDPHSAFRPDGCRVLVLGAGAPRSMGQQATVAEAIEYVDAVTLEELEELTDTGTD